MVRGEPGRRYRVAAGRGVGLIFAKGQVVRKVPEAEIVEALFEEIARMSDRGDDGSEAAACREGRRPLSLAARPHVPDPRKWERRR